MRKYVHRWYKPFRRKQKHIQPGIYTYKICENERKRKIEPRPPDFISEYNNLNFSRKCVMVTMCVRNTRFRIIYKNIKYPRFF